MSLRFEPGLAGRQRQSLADELWERLESFSETFTCYSAAIATWTALGEERWRSILNPGLALTVAEADGGLLRFSHFPPGLREEVGLVRKGCEGDSQALAEILDEVQRSGRVIVAGDAFHQPWHVAFGRRHVPHWFVIASLDGVLTVLDPFACRNELGLQRTHRAPVAHETLVNLLPALPNENPVFGMRESLAFGDDAPPVPWHPYQWFVRAEVGACRRLIGPEGPSAVLRLAAHFRDHGQDLWAYEQADDVWSIGRHRAFLLAHASEVVDRRPDAALSTWIDEHAAPLARRWAHVAPLMMQATLALRAGRAASTSVADTLVALASQEQAAAQASRFAGGGKIGLE